jgi:hypothetical protein
MAVGKGLKFDENLIAFNTLEQDPNMRGPVPMLGQIYAFAGDLVAGVLAIDDIVSPFGTGIGAIIGATILDGIDSANDNLAVRAEAGGTDGTIKITVQSTDATATTTLAVNVIVYGKVYGGDA